MTYGVFRLVKISNISPKITIQVGKNKYFKVPIFDKSWINYKRSSGALAIKCRSERLMSKEAKTLYYENNLILITTKGAEHVSINDNLFNFSYELDSKEKLQLYRKNLLNSINQKKKGKGTNLARQIDDAERADARRQRR